EDFTNYRTGRHGQQLFVRRFRELKNRWTPPAALRSRIQRVTEPLKRPQGCYSGCNGLSQEAHACYSGRTLSTLLHRKELVHTPTRPRARDFTHTHPLKKAMSIPHGFSRFTVHSLSF